jgi:hypothetical protein
VRKGAKLLTVLAAYDRFQLDHRIKPDYCNVGGLQQLDDDGEWTDWYDDETGSDDPIAFAAFQPARDAP